MSAQRITLALGILYVAIGILGFVPGVTSNGLLLGIFAVNALHNIAHLVIGAVLLWASMSPASLTMVNRAMAVVFALLVVASFVAPVLEQLPLNPPDTVLHLVSMLIAGYVGFVARPALGGA